MSQSNFAVPNDEVIEAAATVVLLRDGDAGLEVFMMRRAAEASVYGGAHVFPGGKLDPGDHAIDLTRLDRTAEELLITLGESALTPAGAAALYVAALRELFEESGVLLAVGVQGTWQPSLHSEFARGRAFNEMVHVRSLRLATRAIAPWSRWITPIVPGMKRRRFDARFFVALMPPDQTARVADHESTMGCWLAPSRALTMYWQREIELSPPQIFTLSHLNRYRHAQAAFEARRARLPPLIEPLYLTIEGRSLICYPGDTAHPLREPAFPGTSRLILRGSRFEPADGLEALIGKSVF